MEANKLIDVDGARKIRATLAGEPGAKAGFRQPTSEEMAGLTFAELRDVRIDAQDLRNKFARLLNRGSSLE